MCRITFEHYMHHDVRTPVALDVDGGEDAPLYAHPWRTTTHVCDIDIGHSLEHLAIDINAGVDDNAEPGRPGLCEYHSCCVCRIFVERCEEEDMLPEPEECVRYVLEHRHARLDFREAIWNEWAQIRDWMLGLPAGTSATDVRRQPAWRELAEVSVGHNWQPVYRRGDTAQQVKWTGWMLDEMARLHALREEDAHALAEVRERGLEPGGFARMDRLATAAENVRNHETFIRDELERAATWPDQ
ncbi:hypothetical protein PG988_000485 [Apiospora saccharicola]